MESEQLEARPHTPMQLRVFCRPLVAQIRSCTVAEEQWQRTHTHTENTLTSGWTCVELTPVNAVFSLGFDFLVRHLQKSKPKKTTEQQSGGRRVQWDDTSCWNVRLKSTGNKTDHFLFAFLPCCLCIYRPAAVVALNVNATQLVKACRRNFNTTGRFVLGHRCQPGVTSGQRQDKTVTRCDDDLHLHALYQQLACLARGITAEPLLRSGTKLGAYPEG